MAATISGAIVDLFGQPKGQPISYTISGAKAVEKLQLMQLLDPRTCSGATTASARAACAGLAAVERVAADTSTKMGCYTQGIFNLKCSGNITLGEPVQMAGPGNYIIKAVAPASGAQVLGWAMETGSDEALINVRVNL